MEEINSTTRTEFVPVSRRHAEEYKDSSLCVWTYKPFAKC